MRSFYSRASSLRALLDPVVVVFASAVLVVHVAIYVSTTGSPFDASPRAWDGWWDQGQYLRSARALANANFNAEEHWYPLGYPLLGAPFAAFVQQDPFFIVNTLSLLVFATAFLMLFRPIIGNVASVFAFFAAQLWPLTVSAPHQVNVPVWMQYVFPWNTTPIAALLVAALVLVRGLRVDDRGLKDVVLGLIFGAVVTIRPGDAGALIVPAAFYLHQRLLLAQTLHRVASAAVAAGIVLGAYVVLSYIVYGGLHTPYHDAVAAIGASTSDWFERAYAILIDARVTHNEPALATLQPWLVLALPLATAWALMDERRGLLIVGTVAVSLFSYISFNDFWPYALVRHFLLHYVAWALPVLTAAGIAGALCILRGQRWGIAAIVIAVTALLVSFRLEAVTVPAAIEVHPQPNGHTRYVLRVGESTEIDAIDFAGATTTDPVGVTTKSFAIHADGEELVVYRGFRPLQMTHGLRIGFTRDLEPGELSVVLDNTILNQPQDADGVRALRFTWTRGIASLAARETRGVASLAAREARGFAARTGSLVSLARSLAPSALGGSPL